MLIRFKTCCAQEPAAVGRGKGVALGGRMVTVGLGAGVAGGGAVVEIGLGAMLATLIEGGEVVAGAESLAGGLVIAGLPQALTRKNDRDQDCHLVADGLPAAQAFLHRADSGHRRDQARGADPFSSRLHLADREHLPRIAADDNVIVSTSSWV